MGPNYFPGMISDSGAWYCPIVDSLENLAISLAFYFFFVWERVGVSTIDPSVPSGSVHAL